MSRTPKRRRELGSGLGAALGLVACNGAVPPPEEPPQAHPITPAPSASVAPKAPDCHEEARREAHGRLRLEGGKWLVEAAGPRDTRVWEMSPNGPRLRARIEPDELQLLPEGRLAARSGDDVVFVDLAAGKAAVAAHTRFVSASAEFFFVGDDDRGRRLRAADLAPAGAVAWDKALDQMGARDDARVVDGGNGLIVGGTLVSFVTERVLRKGVLFGASRPDGKRVAACDPASRAIVEVDAATGAIGARFPQRLPRDGEACGTDANAAYADDHTIFWFEKSRETRDAGFRLVVAAGDTRTSAVTRFEDPEQTWSIGFSSYPYLEDGRLCTTIASFHTSLRVCDWVLSRGRIVRSASRAGPSLRSLGLAGAEELARAASPSKARVAVLTYRRTGKEESRKDTDLRLTIVGRDGKKERSVVLEPGEVAVPDTSPGEVGEPLSPPPELWFFDEATIGLLPAPRGLPRSLARGRENASLSRLVDASTGAARPLCGDGDDDCYRVGGLVVLGKGKLLDPLTGRSFDLAASEAEWAAALRVQAPCP